MVLTIIIRGHNHVVKISGGVHREWEKTNEKLRLLSLIKKREACESN